MTVSFSFDHTLTPEEMAAISELNRLANMQRGGAVRQAVVTPENVSAAAVSPAPARPAMASDGPTEADVRAAIARAKERIWGAGHETDPALTREAKAPLVAAFKEIARRHGADKPSALPTPEARGRFIAECDVLALNADGGIEESDLPF